jgi:hypothetical protein
MLKPLGGRDGFTPPPLRRAIWSVAHRVGVAVPPVFVDSNEHRSICRGISIANS